MAQESTAVEQAISRAIRDNLERIQRTTDELNQAVNDVVSACASSKPTNALAPMLRAQSTAASVAAAFEVLSRFVAVTLSTGPRSPMEAEMARLSSAITAEAARLAPAAVPEVGHSPVAAQPAVSESAKHEAKVSETPDTKAVEKPTARESVAPVTADSAAPAPAVEPAKPLESFETQKKTDWEDSPAEKKLAEKKPAAKHELLQAPVAKSLPDDLESEGESDFDVNQLSAEERELHRRANRVAKVSMQDIKMLRPEQVRLGREKKDLCIRLRDDIEKAHREYDRRFRPIMDHPVDYFYRWMVEILADGDAHALGEYPYAIHAVKR
jgi:hypothetical protein